MINLQTLKTQISFFNVFIRVTILLIRSTFSHHGIYLTVKENFNFFFAIVCNETRFRNGLLVVIIPSTGGSSKLILCFGFFVHAVLNFTVRFAIKNHLVPGIVLFENVYDVFVMKILGRTWIHKRSILQTIILTPLLISFTDIKCLKHIIILQFKTRLSRSVLYKAQHLQIKTWIFDKATVTTNVFICNFCFANVTFILNFNEIMSTMKPQTLTICRMI